MRRLTLLCIAVALLAGGLPAGSKARAGPGGGGRPAEATLAVLERAAGRLTLELLTPEPALEAVAWERGTCYRVEVPGLAPYTRDGAQPLPARGALLAVPAEGLRLEVLDASAVPLGTFPLCPAVRPACREGSTDLPCEVVLARDLTDSSKPVRSGRLAASVAELGFTGALRGVPIARVLLYPLGAEGDALWYIPRLRVRLTWDPARPAALPHRARVAGSPFDAVLSSAVLGLDALPIAEEPAPPSASRDSRLSTPDSALKVLVDHDALYRLTYDDLTGAGWDPASFDPRTLRLTLQGAEVAIRVVGEGDGRFDPGDLVLFYGQGAQSPTTRRNVYWLSAGGEPGPRMATRDVSPTHGYPLATSFPANLHAEHDSAAGYWQNPPGREAQDHWYWTAPLNAPASADLPFTLPARVEGSQASLRVRLAGATDDPLDPDHHTRILLNGTELDDALWNGQIEFEHAVSGTLPLLEGANTLRVQSLGGTGALVDRLYPNWLEVGYEARYVAGGDRLSFGAPSAGAWQFRVTCFTGPGVEAFDITDPAAPVFLEGVATVPESACYTAVLEDTAGAGTRYLALTPAQRQPPAAIVPDLPSDLRNPANQADYLVITYDGFYTDTLPLLAHRQARGLTVAAARLTDVYDEFAGGRVTPQAIRDLLEYAYFHWAPPAPAYVLLVGDAHLDWLDRFGTGRPIYLPTRIFDATDMGETADDTWFACVDGDDPLPDLFLGRLPAGSPADLQAMVAKIIAYETDPPTGDWARRALFVADDDQPIFEFAAEEWIARLPFPNVAERVYAGDYPPGDPQADIVGAVNAGDLLVTYIGHGNQDRWGTWGGNQRLFDKATVAQLDNAGRLPFFATATCLNGFFVNPLPGYEYCLAEELVRRPQKAAIAAWSPSALGSPVEHQVLFDALFDALFAGSAPALGAVTTQAKAEAYAQGVSRELLSTFLLFGDPALRMPAVRGSALYLPLVTRTWGGP